MKLSQITVVITRSYTKFPFGIRSQCEQWECSTERGSHCWQM